MRTLKRYSLVWRLLTIVGTAFVVTTLAVFLLLNHLVRHEVQDSGREVYARRLETLVRTLEYEAARPGATELSTLQAVSAIHPTDPADSIFPFVLDAAGAVLVHPSIPVGELAQQLLKTSGDADVWVVTAVCESWNWTVGFQVPRDLLGADADRIGGQMALAWAGVALLVAAILAAVLRRETRPLLDLADAASAMASGNLQPDVHVDHPGEIGTLARGFVDMRNAINRQLGDLRESESRYRQIFDAMADALLLLDQDGTIVAANPRAAAAYGWSLPQLVGRPVASLLRENDRELAQALRSPPADRPLSLSGVTCDRESHELETEIGAVRLAFQGTPHALVILRIVAEQRQLERQLLQSQKLESVGRLAGGIAHDFNNLLTPVLGYTEMLMDNELLDAEARSDLAAIRRAGERARNLARQLLAFSKRQVLEMQDIDLGRTLMDFEPILRRTLREDIELVLKPDGGDHRVRADISQIEQILMNLAINAMDAMPDGGRIEIETEFRALTGEQLSSADPELGPGDYVGLVVRDTGHGVPPAIFDHIVEPFFTTKDAGKGTGLGLATVHGIVQQHGGQIAIRNRDGGGCEVTILLPCLPAVSATGDVPDESVAEVARGAGEVVVLVEDDDMVRELVERLLTKHGYAVRSFATGDACLEALVADPDPADVLLTDVVMPGLNGPELRDQLHEAGLLLPALFMSGYTGDTLLRRGLADARADFLQKPILPEQLLRKLSHMLKSSGTAGA